MENENTNLMKEYLRPSVFYLCAGIGFLLLGLYVGLKTGEIAVLLIFGVIGVLNSITTIKALSRYNSQIQSLSTQGKLGEVASEFKTADQYCKSNLRMGENHIFGRKSGRIVGYQDISRVFQYVHKTNFAEDKRELRIITKDNEVISLCKLELRGASDSELNVVISRMTRNNPSIQIGYK